EPGAVAMGVEHPLDEAALAVGREEGRLRTGGPRPEELPVGPEQRGERLRITRPDQPQRHTRRPRGAVLVRIVDLGGSCFLLDERPQLPHGEDPRSTTRAPGGKRTGWTHEQTPR